jgi:quercetin dioxygenase-like cupin family protein
MPQGAVFPEHKHLGDEAVLVVQGSFEDGVSGRVYRAGDVVRMGAGSSHDFRARPGPALVYLVVLAEGLQIGDAVFGPDDPAM